MRRLFLRAYAQLVVFDICLARGNFDSLIRRVREFRTRGQAPQPELVEQACHAIDLACVWYWKEVLCLQRSAATTCLLKRCGVPARLVIGAQQIPFKAHAWVEVDGSVVNDKPYVSQIYAVLDKC